MTHDERAQFVIELIDNVKRGILAKLPDVPDDWDGWELRQLIADHFDEARIRGLPPARKRAYRKAVLAKNLV